MRLSEYTIAGSTSEYWVRSLRRTISRYALRTDRRNPGAERSNSEAPLALELVRRSGRDLPHAREETRRMALDDPDLEPLWNWIKRE
jgi:hypothetical protein